MIFFYQFSLYQTRYKNISRALEFGRLIRFFDCSIQLIVFAVLVDGKDLDL